MEEKDLEKEIQDKGLTWRDGRRIVPVRTRFDPLGHRTFVLK